MAKPFIPKIDGFLRKLEVISFSGSTNKTLKTISDGVKNSKGMTSALKFSPPLYNFAHKIIPAVGKHFIDDIKKGAKAPRDINIVVGYFYRALKSIVPK